MTNISKEFMAVNLVLDKIRELKDNLLYEEWVDIGYCNNSSNGFCTLYNKDCNACDKVCMQYEVTELLDAIDKLKPTTIINKKPKIKFETSEKEMVDHPIHYNQGIETIEYIESWSMNFNIGNVVKYVTRAGYKGDQLEDLKKAMWYLDREIQRLENVGE